MIFDLRDEIKAYYIGKKYFKDEKYDPILINNVSETLISKIMMGTFGCVPAYDTYVKKALNGKNISGGFSKKSLEGIIDAFQEEGCRKIIMDYCEKLNKMHNNAPIYTPMKIIDIFLWEEGFNSSKAKKK